MAHQKVVQVSFEISNVLNKPSSPWQTSQCLRKSKPNTCRDCLGLWRVPIIIVHRRRAKDTAGGIATKQGSYLLQYYLIRNNGMLLIQKPCLHNILGSRQSNVQGRLIHSRTIRGASTNIPISTVEYRYCHGWNYVTDLSPGWCYCVGLRKLTERSPSAMSIFPTMLPMYLNLWEGIQLVEVLNVSGKLLIVWRNSNDHPVKCRNTDKVEIQTKSRPSNTRGQQSLSRFKILKKLFLNRGNKLPLQITSEMRSGHRFKCTGFSCHQKPACHGWTFPLFSLDEMIGSARESLGNSTGDPLRAVYWLDS